MNKAWRTTILLHSIAERSKEAIAGQNIPMESPSTSTLFGILGSKGQRYIPKMLGSMWIGIWSFQG